MSEISQRKFYVFEPTGAEMPSVIVISSSREVKPAYLRERLKLGEPKQMNAREIIERYGINNDLRLRRDLELGGTFVYHTSR